MSTQSEAETWIPSIGVLCRMLGISRPRLECKGKVAIEIDLLRLILEEVAKNLLFEQDFYLMTYPDVYDLYRDGRIEDLHQHFIKIGFYEGRLPADPHVDEVFYRTEYPDIEIAATSGDLPLIAQHYVEFGAEEGRCPNAKIKARMRRWRSALEDDITS